MSKQEIDHDRLCVRLRRLRKDALLALLDRAIDLLPKTRLPALIDGYLDPEDLRPDRAAGGTGLLAAVVAFHDAGLAGEYYEDFMVDSRNFMETSDGTATWMEECRRLFDRCVATANRRPGEEVREAFEILFGLLRHVDEGEDDVVFFADEGGSWQVGIDWRTVLPAYFTCLAGTVDSAEYAVGVEDVIRDFGNHDRAHHLKAARAAANPDQKRALRRKRTRR